MRNVTRSHPPYSYDCNGTPAQNWTITTGETKVQLAGTNFCLDAGSTPGNGVGMKIWQCYAGLAAQEWYLTDDNRIALENQGSYSYPPGTSHPSDDSRCRTLP